MSIDREKLDMALIRFLQLHEVWTVDCGVTTFLLVSAIIPFFF